MLSFQEAGKKFQDVEVAIEKTFSIKITVTSRRLNCKIVRAFRQSSTA